MDFSELCELLEVLCILGGCVDSSELCGLSGTVDSC